jgi:hypothetical protein
MQKIKYQMYPVASCFNRVIELKLKILTLLETLDPMGKMFQNASSLKPLGQMKPNCPGMIIGRSSTNFMFLCRSEIQDGRHRNT